MKGPWTVITANQSSTNVTDHTFIKVLEKRIKCKEGITNISKPYTWFFSVAVNLLEYMMLCLKPSRHVHLYLVYRRKKTQFKAKISSLKDVVWIGPRYKKISRTTCQGDTWQCKCSSSKQRHHWTSRYLETINKTEELTPSFPFILLQEWSVVFSLFSLCIDEVLDGDSEVFGLLSLPLLLFTPLGSFPRLRFKTQFPLSILPTIEPFSFIGHK